MHAEAAYTVGAVAPWDADHPEGALGAAASVASVAAQPTSGGELLQAGRPRGGGAGLPAEYDESVP